MTMQDDLEAALRTWVDALSPHTRRAYERGLCQFAEYLFEQGRIALPAASTADPRAPMRRDVAGHREDLVALAGSHLLALGQGGANALAQAWIQHLCAVDELAGLPPYTRETVKQRVSALRWAVREARRRGLVAWHLDVVVPRPTKDPQTGRLRVKTGRDMRGPTPEQLRMMLELAQRSGRGEAGDGARRLLVLSLIAHETLRAHEICALDLGDVHAGTRTLQVTRKKDDGPSVIPLSAATFRALRRWVRRRGRAQGPLVWGSRIVGGHAQVVSGSRLTCDGLRYIVGLLGAQCGFSTAPHKVRHTAITVGQSVRERLSIPLHDAMARAGHKSIAAHERYLDPDLDNVRRLNDAVAQALSEGSP